MTDHTQLVRRAFAALNAGDLESFGALFDPAAQWVGVPQGGPDETPVCSNRALIVERLSSHHANGRRFELGKLIEDRARVAVEVTILSPEWSGPVTVFKVFTFAPDSDAVVRLNDCIDESYALQVLAA